VNRRRARNWPSLSGHARRKGEFMLWTIFVVLVVLWLLGFSLHIGGALIHILIVIAVIVLIFNLISGRRGV
jgi:hypothetical protein